MTDFCLKFASKQEYETLMQSIFEDNLSDLSIDEIGTIFSLLDPPTELPGWHVNLRTNRELTQEQLDLLSVVQVFPSSPVRIWL